MGLLDDLKTEAKEKEYAEQKRTAELAAQEEFYQAELKPVMQRANHYFAELVENLVKVAPEIFPTYPLGPSQQADVTLEQGDYTVRTDQVDDLQMVAVQCQCSLVQPREFYVRTSEAVRKYADLLDEYSFRHHCKNQLDARHEVVNATFILEGPMTAQIRVVASAPDRCIYIELNNLEEQPQKRYKFAPEKVDEDLLDRLARMLVREESKLVEVKISDDVRDEFRRKVELEQRRNEEEMADALAYREAERAAEKEARLVNRATRAGAGATASVWK